MQNISLKRRVENVLAYVQRGDAKGLLARWRYHRREAQKARLRRKIKALYKDVWAIVALPEHSFIAHCIATRLGALGIKYDILSEPPGYFDYAYYVVIGPQTYNRLPPRDQCIFFQTIDAENLQLASDDYFETLANSLATLDHSLVSIDVLADRGVRYPHIHYVPLGAVPSLLQSKSNAEKQYDFAFCGDEGSSARTREMLAALRANFTVIVCENLLGDDMHARLRQARAVINVHQQDRAALEIPHLLQCLSFGVPVLSENGSNRAEYPELEQAITYFDSGSTDGMLTAAGQVLRNLDTYSDRMASVLAASSGHFNFMFDRCLVALGILPPSHWDRQPIHLPNNDRPVALSLPETIKRRNAFVPSRHPDCVVFDGIRHKSGWIGCGLSYKTLARHAISQRLDRLTVFEDDAIFAPDHAQKISIVDRYLQHREAHWDIFSGVIAAVHPNTEVLSVDELDGMMFVTIDHMTSTVYNIYQRRALDVLAAWDPTDEDHDNNTIDKFIERQTAIRIVVALPFLVGHRDDVHSTLWNFKNTIYSEMIAESESKLLTLATAWKNANRPSAAATLADEIS